MYIIIITIIMHSTKNIQEWKLNPKITHSTICPCAQHAVRCMLFGYLANDVLGGHAAAHLQMKMQMQWECNGSFCFSS